jgi:hypothetical protein
MLITIDKYIKLFSLSTYTALKIATENREKLIF